MDVIKFDEKGLVPAIVQDVNTKKVLMLAYMNEESLKKTLETGTTWFYSRSRQELWNKGATSGNLQHVKSLSYDCDGDAILVEVVQDGVACHTGSYSCFFNTLKERADLDELNPDIITDLIGVIRHRHENPQEGSYTNFLFEKGIDKILKKVGEEASEVIIAAKNTNHEELCGELADLLYHTLVLMELKGVTAEDIKKVLTERHQ